MDSSVGRGVGRLSLAGLSAGLCHAALHPAAALHPTASRRLGPAAHRVSAVAGSTYLTFAFHNSSRPFAKGTEPFTSKGAFISSQLSSAAGSQGGICGLGSWHHNEQLQGLGWKNRESNLCPAGCPDGRQGDGGEGEWCFLPSFIACSAGRKSISSVLSLETEALESLTALL